MLKVTKFKLYPNKEIEDKLFSNLRICSFVYNLCVDHNILDDSVLPQLKEMYPDVKEVHSKVLQNVVQQIRDNIAGLSKKKKKGKKKKKKEKKRKKRKRKGKKKSRKGRIFLSLRVPLQRVFPHPAFGTPLPLGEGKGEGQKKREEDEIASSSRKIGTSRHDSSKNSALSYLTTIGG